MVTNEEIGLGPMFDGLQASIKALISEVLPLLNDDHADIRRRMARSAAADIMSRTKNLDSDAKRNLMLMIVARTFDVPYGEVAGN